MSGTAGPADAGTDAIERQDPASVRRAAEACFAAGAATFAWALTVLAMRRSGATAADWAFVVRALIDPGNGAGDGAALADTCLRHALSESHESAELRSLRADVDGALALRDGSTDARHDADAARPAEQPRGESATAGVYRGGGEVRSPGEQAIFDRLLDALDGCPAGALSMEAFLGVPDEMQDVALGELGDEGEPRTAPLVAALLHTSLPPALGAYLLENIAPFARHPDVLDAVLELDGRPNRFPGPELEAALRTVEEARGDALLYRPHEGRSAPQREGGARPLRKNAPGAAPREDRIHGVLFNGHGVPRGRIRDPRIAVLMVVLAPIGLAFAFGPEWLAAIPAGLVALVAIWKIHAHALRAPFRLVAGDDGARFELDDAERSKRLPFPLDYRAAWHKHVIQTRLGPQAHPVLRLALLDSHGHTAVVLEEGPLDDDPPRGWVEDELPAPRDLTYFVSRQGGHLIQLARDLARLNRSAEGH